jgi:glutathione S-transferase
MGAQSMKLYSAPYPAPNPRRVLIFMAEQGISMPIIDLSIVKAEHKAPDFVAKNSRGQVPVLELDDGTFISESLSICHYLDEVSGGPSLFGNSAIERAHIDMWVRRIEFNVMAPVGLFWAHAHPFTARVITQFKDFGQSNRARFESVVKWLDGELSGQEFIAGDKFTIADITAFCTFEFAEWIGLPIPDTATHVSAWYNRIGARDSVVSLKPAA